MGVQFFSTLGELLLLWKPKTFNNKLSLLTTMIKMSVLNIKAIIHCLYVIGCLMLCIALDR